MPDDLITIRLRLTGGSAAAAEAKAVAGQIDGISGSTARAGQSAGRFRSTMSSVGRTIKYAAIPVIGGLAYEMGRSINAFRESRKVSMETEAHLKSTGHAAGVTADEVGRLANNLSLKTGVDDEEVQSASNMLLTFTKIRNEVGEHNDIFNQATESVLDLAAATKTDGVSAAKQLGKALNDPTTGLTALRRSGASFNAEQTEMIQKLFESGNRLKAQKLILSELTNEFAGSAKANHDAVDRFGVAWENLEETLGKALYPILQDVTNWLTKAIRQAQHGKGPLIDIKDAFVDFGGGVKWTVERIKDFIEVAKVIVIPFREIVGLAEKFHDLTQKDLITPSLDFADPLSGFANDAAHATSGNRHRGAGKAPIPERAPRRRGSTKKRVIQVNSTVVMDGREVGRGITKHALVEAARA